MDPTIQAFGKIQREIKKVINSIGTRENKLLAIQLAENTLAEFRQVLEVEGGK